MAQPSTVPPAAMQERSRRTRQEILQAGFAVLSEAGLEALTIQTVAKRAGVAVGSVYRRFGDKERLLAAIQQAFVEQVESDFKTRLASAHVPKNAAPTRICAVAVDAMIDTFHNNATLLRVFLVLGSERNDVYRVGARASIGGNRAFASFLTRAGIGPERADDVDFAYRLLYAMCAHRVTHGEYLESDHPFSWDDLRRQAATIVTQYLLD